MKGSRRGECQLVRRKGKEKGKTRAQGVTKRGIM